MIGFPIHYYSNLINSNPVMSSNVNSVKQMEARMTAAIDLGRNQRIAINQNDAGTSTLDLAHVLCGAYPKPKALTPSVQDTHSGIRPKACQVLQLHGLQTSDVVGFRL